MKDYATLTHLGKLRRLRQVARTALPAYGLDGAPFHLVVDAGNTLYKVNGGPLPGCTPAGDLFEEGQYLLRLHWLNYQTPAAIELELSWLLAMRKADLPVPEPVPCLDGRLLTTLPLPGSLQPRHISLLRWVKGRLLGERAQAQHFQAQGQLMARLHNFASQYQSPPGHSKHCYDYAGLFMDYPELPLSSGECWNYVPAEWLAPFRQVAERTRCLMETWGQGSSVYGLIHADMATDANVLFWQGRPRLIDFDSSGFGYYMYDIAVALEHISDKPAYPELRCAFLDGYTSARGLPAEQLAQLELFQAASYVYWGMWALSMTALHPQYLADLRDRIARAGRLVFRYINASAT
jgi:Ser/Thr protein kinase RdoA (MazF antagonist)